MVQYDIQATQKCLLSMLSSHLETLSIKNLDPKKLLPMYVSHVPACPASHRKSHPAIPAPTGRACRSSVCPWSLWGLFLSILLDKYC